MNEGPPRSPSPSIRIGVDPRSPLLHKEISLALAYRDIRCAQNRRCPAYQVMSGDSSTPGDIDGVLSSYQIKQNNHHIGISWTCSLQQYQLNGVSSACVSLSVNCDLTEQGLSGELTLQSHSRRPLANLQLLLEHHNGCL